MRARPSEWRYGGCGARMTRASAALILAQAGRIVMLVLFVLLPIGLAAPLPARAVSPDPSSQTPAASSAASPTPDPAPLVGTQSSSESSSGSASRRAQTSQPPTITPRLLTAVPVIPVPSTRRSHPLSSRAQRRPARTAVRSAAAQVPSRNRDLLGAQPGVAGRPPAPHRSGVLLLLAALALSTVVVASSSLLRLLGRMREELWE